MADFINFEADIEGDDEEIGEEDDEVSNISDVDSENSFIDNQKVKTYVIDILLMLRIILIKF